MVFLFVFSAIFADIFPSAAVRSSYSDQNCASRSYLIRRKQQPSGTSRSDRAPKPKTPRVLSQRGPRNSDVPDSPPKKDFDSRCRRSLFFLHLRRLRLWLLTRTTSSNFVRSFSPLPKSEQSQRIRDAAGQVFLHGVDPNVPTRHQTHDFLVAGRATHGAQYISLQRFLDIRNLLPQRRPMEDKKFRVGVVRAVPAKARNSYSVRRVYRNFLGLTGTPRRDLLSDTSGEALPAR